MASKRRVRRKSCTGKVRHKSLQDANCCISKTFGFRDMKAYKCKFCKGFHIGHKPNSKRYTNNLQYI